MCSKDIHKGFPVEFPVPSPRGLGDWQMESWLRYLSWIMWWKCHRWETPGGKEVLVVLGTPVWVAVDVSGGWIQEIAIWWLKTQNLVALEDMVFINLSHVQPSWKHHGSMNWWVSRCHCRFLWSQQELSSEKVVLPLVISPFQPPSISEVEMEFLAGATSANGRPGWALHASWTSAFACPLGKSNHSNCWISSATICGRPWSQESSR